MAAVSSTPAALRRHFQLEPEVVFLNHGSFGALPLPVMAAQQAWQRRMERQPVHFFITELPALLGAARATLAELINARPNNLVYIPNATFGVNVVARSLQLGPDDEVLATDHEYGACRHVWQFLSERHGFAYRQQPVPLPLGEPADVVARFWEGVTPRTRLIFISHITSPTAVRLPVAAICARARQEGILTLVDGAHAVGQIPLDMAAIGADFYVSNAHKWLCSPKGSAFLHVRPEQQARVEPLVVSWGWGEGHAFQYGSRLLDYLQWMGTDDPTPYLTVPDAIAFQAAHQWPVVRERCNGLLAEGLARIDALTGLPSLYRHAPAAFAQMGAARLPTAVDTTILKKQLWESFRIEVPLVEWGGYKLVRVSIQGYNGPSDVDALVEALSALLT